MDYSHITFNYKHQIPDWDSTKMDLIKWRFAEFDITIDKLAQIVFDNQRKYIPDLSFDEARESIIRVLEKREVQHSLVTAINLDVLAENKLLVGPLQSILVEDRGTYGVDEIFMLTSLLYGTIGLTNAMALDITKVGIIKEVDQIGKTTEYTTTMLDDQLSIIVGSAQGHLAHKYDSGHDDPTDLEENWD